MGKIHGFEYDGLSAGSAKNSNFFWLFAKEFVILWAPLAQLARAADS